jgi:PadR family transcriptional regulator, regulatory protein PadR
MGDDRLGEFEQIVLLAVLRLGDGAYGLSVRREILSRTGREVAIGAVYATLDRLEDKGHLRSRLGAASPERGGRAKRCFTLTAQGQRALAQAQRDLAAMAAGLDLKWRPA